MAIENRGRINVTLPLEYLVKIQKINKGFLNNNVEVEFIQQLRSDDGTQTYTVEKIPYTLEEGAVLTLKGFKGALELVEKDTYEPYNKESN